MNILVCVKQVPDTTEIRIDPVTNTLIRDGVESIVNPFDSYALEFAGRIKDTMPECRVTLLSMGPMQAREALRDCLARGADEAYLVSDRKFGGADTLATSFTLACAIKEIERRNGKAFDIIFCGKQAIDGDTAQVGPEIAEHLGYPQVTCAVEVVWKEKHLEVKREIEKGFEILEIDTPCVITATKPYFEPRHGTLLTKIAAARTEIVLLTAEDLGLAGSEEIGLKGSPTRVRKTFTPPQKSGGMRIKADSAQEAVKELLKKLQESQVI